jgi:hypothetical protein
MFIDTLVAWFSRKYICPRRGHDDYNNRQWCMRCGAVIRREKKVIRD